MKKLISAVTSLCMAATMVSAVAPMTVGAADATKGFYVKTYDETKPDMANGSSTITVKKSDIGANGYKIPAAMYLDEATNNDTGSLSVNLTCDSPSIAFKVLDPTAKYYDSEKNVTLATGSGSTDRYITWGGIMDEMDGYTHPGYYVFGCDSSQKSAGTNNYFLGLSWMNNGADYAWAGSTSTAYPLYAFDITLKSDIEPGTYHVDIMHYDTDPDEKITVMTPMIEARRAAGDAARKYSLEDNNLKTEGLTIKVEGDGPVVTTTTTAPVAQPTTTTTAPVVTPVGDKDFNFKIVDKNGNSNINANAGDELQVSLIVDAGNNTCAGLDAQYDLGGLELVQMGKKANALGGATLNPNPAEARISVMSVSATTGEPTAVTNGESVSVIKIKVPEDAANGKVYTLSLVADELHVFKEGGSGDKYSAGFTPMTITVGEPTPGVTTTTTAPIAQPTTTTTTAPVVGDKEFNFKIVDKEGKSSGTAKAGDELQFSLIVDAGNNTCAGLDAQYDLGGLELVQMGKKANALGGATLNPNPAEARISVMSVSATTGEPTAVTNGESVSVIKVKVPENAKNGDKFTLTLVADELHVFKEGGSGDKYSAGFTGYELTVGDGVVTTTTTTPPTTTTTTTTTAPVDQPTTTTTTAPVVTPGQNLKPTWGDVNCDGNVNVADVVVLNRFLADPTYANITAQGKVNGDVKDPQDKSGAAVDPAKVQLTAADSETILKAIVELVTLPQ